MTNPKATGTSPETPAVTTNNTPDSSDTLAVVKTFLPELVKGQHWLNWRYINGEEGKSPITQSGKLAGYADPEAWITLTTALKRCREDATKRIGLTLRSDGLQVEGKQLLCLDFDGFAHNGEFDEGVADAMSLLKTYVETSPSGTGFKAYFLTEQPPEGKRKIRFAKSKFAAISEARKYHNREIEVFSQGFFLAFSGVPLAGQTYRLRSITADETQSIFGYLDTWAKNTGGTGFDKAASDNAKTYGGAAAIDYSRLTERSLSVVISHIDPDDEGCWSDTANALARVYGEDGRIYFHEYAQRSDKYDEDDNNARFDRALRDLEDRPSGVGCPRLIQLAQDNPNFPRAFAPEYEPDSWFANGNHAGFVELDTGRKDAGAKTDAADASNNWPEIKPLSPKNPPTPALSTELLPQAIRPYVKDCADRLQVPPEMIATPLLISFGNVIGKKFAIYPKRNDHSWYAHPNLWGCCVAPPSSLKSPTLAAGLRFSAEIEAELRAVHKTELRHWKLSEKLRKISAKKTEAAAVAAKESGNEAEVLRLLSELDEQEPPVCGRLTITDSTPEARLELLRQNPNGLMQVVDELDGYFQKLSKDGYEAARAQDLSFYDGQHDYAEDRVKRGSNFVESPRLAMYGNLQPAKVEGYMRALTSGGRDDGYLQRLFQLVAWPTLSADFQLLNQPEDMAAQELAREAFRTIHNMRLERDPITQKIKPRVLRFTPEAQQAFDALYVSSERANRQNPEANPVLVNHRGKMIGTTIKLSLICALLEDPRALHIDLQALKTAVGLVTFFFTHAKRAYTAATKGGLLAAHALLAKIEAGKVPNPFSARDDVYEKKWSGLSTAAETHEAISILIDHGYLHEVDAGTGGRPRRMYWVNPQLAGG
jgi:Protein of unknown function (DUF3987)